MYIYSYIIILKILGITMLVIDVECMLFLVNLLLYKQAYTMRKKEFKRLNFNKMAVIILQRNYSMYKYFFLRNAKIIIEKCENLILNM